DANHVAALLDRAAANRPNGRATSGLSVREREVLTLVVEGLTNREIAARLAISDKTVANHLTHIFSKIGVENRAAAVAVTLRRQLT
ncbi:MAG TPA: LuxR C-terminal-related transcriptional regulator, partial [Thermomicrobiales bacterium]|nr:LuxR C-terminal-related transcriptional regulator [Thermomicrobiales bacterium]